MPQMKHLLFARHGHAQRMLKRGGKETGNESAEEQKQPSNFPSKVQIINLKVLRVTVTSSRRKKKVL